MIIDVKKLLKSQTELFEKAFHQVKPLERFVMRNGERFQGTAYRGPRMTMKECFRNALELSYYSDSGLDYVEGFAVRKSLGILIHHAWTVDGKTVFDPTWDRPEECFYFGVRFAAEEVWDRCIEREHYGAFYNPMLDVEFLARFDPRIKDDIDTHRKIA